jgi:hypothetical protein
MPRLVGKEDVGVVEPVSIRGESRVSDVLETEGDAVMGSRLELVLPLPSSNKAAKIRRSIIRVSSRHTFDTS